MNFLKKQNQNANNSGLQWLTIAILLFAVAGFNFLTTAPGGGEGGLFLIGIFLLLIQIFFAVLGSLVYTFLQILLLLFTGL